MLLLDTMGMVVLDDVSCLHEDGGAGSYCMFYMEMVVLDDVAGAVVCCAWDITRLRIRMPPSWIAFGYTAGSFACSICA